MTESSGATDSGSLLTTDDSAAPAAAPVEAQAPATQDAAVEGQVQVSFPDNWKQGLPDDIKDDPCLSVVNDIPSLVRNYVNAQKMVGSEKIPHPGKHGTPEQWRDVYHKLGLPQKVEEYEFQMPEGAAFDDGAITELKSKAFEVGILPQQFQQLIEHYNVMNNGALEKQKEEFDVQLREQVQQLKVEWGQAYDAKLRQAKQVLKEFGDENVFSYLEETGLGNSSMLIKLLAKIGGTVLKEDSVLGNPTDASAKTPGDLDKQIGDLQRDAAYLDAAHPGHGQLVRELEELYKRRYPEEGPGY